MRAHRRAPRRALHRLAAVAAVLAQLFVAAGAPVFARPAAGKPGAVPFPCQSRPCGCATSEQGWAGDCCCFTLEQKLAWADARGFEPPAHVRPAVEARRLGSQGRNSCCAKETRPCCDRPAPEPVGSPAVRWVAGVFAQKCRGEGPAGLLKLDLVSVPAASPVPPAAEPVDSLRDLDPRPTPISPSPPEPPPRLA